MLALAYELLEIFTDSRVGRRARNVEPYEARTGWSSGGRTVVGLTWLALATRRSTRFRRSAAR